jgi:hypothetical protein
MKRKSNGSAPDTFYPKALVDLHKSYLDWRWEMAVAVAWKDLAWARRTALHAECGSPWRVGLYVLAARSD